MSKEIVPAQFTGDKSTSEHTVSKPSAEKALETYRTARERLLSVNDWDKICGPHSANFQLMDDKGNPLHHKAAVNDYIRIDLPGPGTKAGSGYDWVIIETIEQKDSPSGNCNYTAIRVRPADSPIATEKQTAHFYEPTATSSFIVQRVGNRLSAYVYGRNESPNTKVNSFMDRIRNLIISISTFLGFQKPQWKSLVVGLLK
jgi:hypothetical protein